MFRTEPKVLPAGESIVWALAKEKGTIAKSLRYPAEDGVYENGKMDKPWLQRFPERRLLLETNSVFA